MSSGGLAFQEMADPTATLSEGPVRSARTRIVETLRRELMGPYDGPNEQFSGEYPTSRYVVGRLAPIDQRISAKHAVDDRSARRREVSYRGSDHSGALSVAWSPPRHSAITTDASSRRIICGQPGTRCFREQEGGVRLAADEIRNADISRSGSTASVILCSSHLLTFLQAEA